MSPRLLTSAAAVAAALLATSGAARADDFQGSVDMNAFGMGISINVNDSQGPGHRGPPPGAQVNIQMGVSEGYSLSYESGPGCTFHVSGHMGQLVRVSEGRKEIHSNLVPTSFRCRPGAHYRIVVQDGPTVVFDKVLESRSGSAMLAVGVSPPPPPPPRHAPPPPPPPRHEPPPPPPPPRHAPPPPPPVASCMDPRDFRSISGEIEEASFSDQKVDVLDSAMRQRSVCASQVIEFIELFNFSNDKIKALEILAPRIVDTENNFKILGAFTFDSDKQKARKILD